MNAKERVFKALNHEEADRVPCSEGTIDNLEVCKYYGTKYIYKGAANALKRLYYLSFKNEKRLTKILTKWGQKKSTLKIGLMRNVKLFKKIGLDLAAIPLCLFPIQYYKNGYIDEFARIMEFKKNPDDKMDVGYFMGGKLKNFEEYEEFNNQHPLDPDALIRERAYMVGKEAEMATKGKLCIMPAFTGVFEVTVESFGIENFSKLIVKPSQFKKVIDDRGKFAVEMVKRINEWGEAIIADPDVVCLFFDDMGYKKGLYMNPKLYQKYVMPWFKEISKTAHKSGMKVVLHSCGDISQILDDIVAAGIDCINPIEPTVTNKEYDIFKLKEKYRDKLSFMGNVSPQDLADKDPEFIREYTKKLLKEVAPGGGFVLASGHSINPAVKLENFLAMRQIAEKYGKYPINLP